MVEIRPGEPADAKAIREIARTSWHAAYDDLLGEETVKRTVEEWYALDELREAIERPGHALYVAEDDDVVGFVHAGPNPDEERIAELYRIYVRPDRWGEGVGGRLLDAVEPELEGYDRLALSVFAENDVGVGFYEKQGFERAGEGTVELEGETYREYRYERSL
ncbi:MAG: GNAT family N-acetyltransferase [Halalkalicoccus sp.]